MSLARLRNQMLIAMGIPACWTGAPPSTSVTPPVTTKATAVMFDPSLCPRDTVPESVCGARRDTARSCGSKATTLSGVDESKLWVTAESDEPDVAYRDFVFDRDETRRFRAGLDEVATRAEHCCYSQCTPMTVGVADPVTTPPAGYFVDNKCIPAPPGGTSKPSKLDAACATAVTFDGVLRPYASSQEGDCCYAVPTRTITIQAIPGRALRVDGIPQVAAIAEHDGWRASIQPRAVGEDVRARLATTWLEIAQLEHASIAAFAALALRLVAAGAPATLIAAAHEAALDEIEHARIAFELASVYGGKRLGPGRFDAALRAPTDGSVRELAIETFIDGCINETAAAHQAAVAAASAEDPQVAAALHRIAGDEGRHAALAWAVVAWCVRAGAIEIPELREIAGRAGGIAEPRNEDLARHGVLGDAATSIVRAAVMREVIEPCLAALA